MAPVWFWLPADFVLMHVTLPDDMVAGIGIAAGETMAGARTVAAGDAWLTEARSAALRVPSVLIPYAWNVLLNPRHADAARAGIAGREPFPFDPRLWQPLADEGCCSRRLIPGPDDAR